LEKLRKNKFNKNIYAQCRFFLSASIVYSFIILNLNNSKIQAESLFGLPSSLPSDSLPIPKPKYHDFNVHLDDVNRQITEQHVAFFDLSRQSKRLLGIVNHSKNVNAFEGVDNSTWFQNRNGLKEISLDDIAVGPNISGSPDSTGPWTLTKAKSHGITAGFQIKDKNGSKYLIKFDPPEFLELSTSVEVIVPLFLHAAGYNVSENYVVNFKPEKIVMGEKVKFTDSRGRKRLMTEADLQEILANVSKSSDGFMRAHASKFISGRPVGPWKFYGTRKDDTNDFIPHEHRREIRGFKIIAAWLNHWDINKGNFLDMYQGIDGQGHVKHYLIDFGAALGASAWGHVPAAVGHENMVQPSMMLFNLLTLGFFVHSWETDQAVQYPSIGRWNSHQFKPNRYKFLNPNRAFANMTDVDAFWGAKIVMSFTNSQIDTIVAQGKYSNPKAAQFVAKILKERRDIIGRYYFEKINPLDQFQMILETGNESNYKLTFSDLAIKYKLEKSKGSRYFLKVKRVNGFIGDKLTSKENAFSISKEWFKNQSQLEFQIVTERSPAQILSTTRVFIQIHDETKTPEVVGLKR